MRRRSLLSSEQSSESAGGNKGVAFLLSEKIERQGRRIASIKKEEGGRTTTVFLPEQYLARRKLMKRRLGS